MSDTAELDPASPTPLVTLVGAGPVGAGLAGKLVRSGVPVAALYGRTERQAMEAAISAGVLGLCEDVSELVRGADVVIVAVSDSRIGEVAEDYARKGVIGSNQVVLHTSGAWAAEELLAGLRGKVKGLGTLHPLASLSQRAQAHARLHQASFAVEGDDVALPVARRLVHRMGGTPMALAPGKMPLYHAGAAIGSNLVVALVDLARRVLTTAGVDPSHVVPALVPLLRSTADNLARQGLPQALTGPVARGDVGTVERHLHALETALPDVAALYRRLGQEVLQVAEARMPELEGKVRETLRGLFRPDGTPADAAAPGDGPQKEGSGRPAAASRRKGNGRA